MANKKSTFAVFLGNRGFFPAALMAGARQDLGEVLHKLGHETLFLDEHATRHGAVETVKEGQVYANFLAQNRGKYDGVILSLPNFGDETGAIAALKDAGVPILVQAYPDELTDIPVNATGDHGRKGRLPGEFHLVERFWFPHRRAKMELNDFLAFAHGAADLFNPARLSAPNGFIA